MAISSQVKVVQLRDVKRSREQELSNYERRRDFVPCVLKAIEGSVEVVDRPNYHWASEYNQPQSIFQVLNLLTPPLANLKVKVGYPEKPPFERQVVGVWGGFEGLSPELSTPPLLPLHRELHQYPTETNPGIDRVLIYQPALQMLKTEPYGSGLVVSVRAHIYYYEGVRKVWPGGTFDVSPYLPATPGNSLSLLLYLNPVTNSLVGLAGAETAGVPILPDRPDTAIPSSYINLTNGQTGISLVSDIEDAREFLHTAVTGAVSGGGGWPFVSYTIDGTDPDADYDNLTTALAAAAAPGVVFVLGPGTFVADIVIPDGVMIVGQGPGLTILEGTGTFDTVEMWEGSVLKDVSVVIDSATTNYGVAIVNANCTLENVHVTASSAASSFVAAVAVLDVTARLIDVVAEATGPTDSYGLWVDLDTPGDLDVTAVTVIDGRYSGETADIHDEASEAYDARIHLIWPVLLHGDAVGNEVYGGYFVLDTGGSLRMVPDIGAGVPFDINALTEQLTPTPSEDYVAIYDAGLADHRKVLLENLGVGGAAASNAVLLLFSQIVDGVVANSADELDLLSAGRGSKEIAADTLEVGTTLRVALFGHLSDTGTPDLTLRLRLGGSLLCAATVTMATGVTDVGWSAEMTVTCRADGATGEVVASGIFHHEGLSAIMVNTTAVTVDTTADQLIQVTAEWSAADAANSITCQKATIERLPVTGLLDAGPSDLTGTETI